MGGEGWWEGGSFVGRKREDAGGLPFCKTVFLQSDCLSWSQPSPSALDWQRASGMGCTPSP